VGRERRKYSLKNISVEGTNSEEEFTEKRLLDFKT
jgi:hypothetical protein